MLLVSVICLLTISSCLTADKSTTCASNSRNSTVSVQQYGSDFNIEIPCGFHHDAVQGKVTDFERIADLSDKGSLRDKKECRAISYGHLRKTTSFTAVHTYSSTLLNSSHLIPATVLRV